MQLATSNTKVSQDTRFNIAGQKVATLVNARLEAGYHSVTWDSRSTSGEPLASGIYLYRLKAGEFVETKKMMLLK